MDEWKDIEGYEDMYKISNSGYIKSIERKVVNRNNLRTIKEKILKYKKDKEGYCSVSLCKNGTVRTFKVHRLVAEAFISNTNNLPQVNHKDENKENNAVSNLEWIVNLKNTNNYHSKNGTKKYGVHKSNDKWRSRIKKDGKSICLGFYESKELAYEAFYNKYKELHGVTPW